MERALDLRAGCIQASYTHVHQVLLFNAAALHTDEFGEEHSLIIHQYHSLLLPGLLSHMEAVSSLIKCATQAVACIKAVLSLQTVLAFVHCHPLS